MCIMVYGSIVQLLLSLKSKNDLGKLGLQKHLKTNQLNHKTI